MIGHYMNTLTPMREGRVLVNPMAPGGLLARNGNRCLLGVIHDAYLTAPGKGTLRDMPEHIVLWPLNEKRPEYVQDLGMRFDALCRRFGIERTTAAIRNRILSNQARRVLTPELEYAMVLR